MFSRCLALVVFLSLGNSIEAQYVSKFGNESLRHSEFVVKGIPTRVTKLRNLGAVVHFQIQEIYWGQLEIGSSINLFYSFAKNFTKGEHVVFLRSVKSQNGYQVVGEFSASDKDAPYKIARLQKLLAIEGLATIADKRDRYLQYCLRGLQSEDIWERWNGFWEWQYLVENHVDWVSQDFLHKIIEIYDDVPEPRLKRLLQRTIIQVKRHFPDSPQSLNDEQELPDFDTRAGELVDKLRKATKTSEQIRFLSLLVRYPSPAARDAMVAVLQEKSPHLRALAAFYLGIYGTPREVPHLLEVLRSDPSIRVRKNAIQSLGQLGAIEATAEITRYIQIPYTRATAQRALQSLTPNLDTTWSPQKLR